MCCIKRVHPDQFFYGFDSNLLPQWSAVHLQVFADYEEAKTFCDAINKRMVRSQGGATALLIQRVAFTPSTS